MVKSLAIKIVSSAFCELCTIEVKMKHIFIINPKAGKGKAYNLIPDIQKEIRKINSNHSIECKIHITKGKDDAKRFCKKMCILNKGIETLRFYACGGDGTLNEVVNGVYGYENVEVGCIPTGTGNDFISNFPGRNFDNISAQISGKTVLIDLLGCKTDDDFRLGVNIVNTGFDCDVVKYMEEGRQKIKSLGGKSLYIYGVAQAFLDINYINMYSALTKAF